MALRASLLPPSVAAHHALLVRDAALQSPVTQVLFRGQRVHVKRDDIFHLAGNKMRKLHWFVTQDDAFYRDAHVVSFGGTQSNAMLAIAQLAHAKRVPFTYYSRGLQLRAPASDAPPPESNLALALALGMDHVALSPAQYQTLTETRDFAVLETQRSSSSEPRRRTIEIPQGAAFAHAQLGLAQLASELNTYMRERPHRDKAFAVVVPSGTGTTALYLAQHVDPRAEVFAVPCIGDALYLRQQLDALVTRDVSLAHGDAKRPTILSPRRKARFGRLAWPLHALYYELLDATAIAFDLNYGAFAWQTMLDALPQLLEAPASRRDERSVATGPRELLYVHTGGVSGNASMLARYTAKRRL